jgi:type VI secretion system secreted protein VgrG
MDDKHLPVDPSTEFKNPVGHVYAIFSYDKLIDGAQWTALWYRNGELVYFETTPWNGGSGGLGYTDWNPAPEEWHAGDYAVYIFLGTEYRVGGYFTVTGNPPGGGPTRTPTKSPIAKFSPTPSRTPTQRSTATSSFTPTVTLTRTPRPTATATRTPPPTSTQFPTRTPRPTSTRLPTPTALPTQKPNSAP